MRVERERCHQRLPRRGGLCTGVCTGGCLCALGSGFCAFALSALFDRDLDDDLASAHPLLGIHTEGVVVVGEHELVEVLRLLLHEEEVLGLDGEAGALHLHQEDLEPGRVLLDLGVLRAARLGALCIELNSFWDTGDARSTRSRRRTRP